MAAEEAAELRIESTAPDDRTVPVDVLVRMLNGLQQMILLFAADAEQQEIQQRFKPSAELRSRYTLVCGVPAEGSYVMPVSLVDTAPQTVLTEKPRILGKVQDFIGAAALDDAARMRELLPDSRYRDRVLRELRGLAPRAGERWTASFQLPGRPEVVIDAGLTRAVERRLVSKIEEPTVMTVTGEPIAIVFDEHKLSIRYPVNGREIECSYVPEIEDDLLESRRGLIQVTGTFVLDADGHPSRLTNVRRIEPVDLTPLVFDVVEADGRRLKAVPALRLIPRLDEESQQLYVIEDADLDLSVYAATREELADEIAAHLLFAWDAYAKASSNILTPKARELANALRARFQEIQ